MAIQKIDDIYELLKGNTQKKRLVVAYANDSHSIEAVNKAVEMGIVEASCWDFFVGGIRGKGLLIFFGRQNLYFCVHIAFIQLSLEGILPYDVGTSLNKEFDLICISFFHVVQSLGYEGYDG